jgi:hypothetical protein
VLIWHEACFSHSMMPYLIIVAVGESQLFRRLQDASGPGVQVLLDRRREERRQEIITVSVDRRHRDRRMPERPGWKVRTLTAVPRAESQVRAPTDRRSQSITHLRSAH